MPVHLKNQKMVSQKRSRVSNLIPIPKAQQFLLQKSNCNFSLYSPRMIEWKGDEKNISSSTDSIEKLKKQTDKSFASLLVKTELQKKHKQQEDYLKSLKDLGLTTFSIEAETLSPFVTGLGSGHPTETGITLDRNLGIPYIPSSSIKGVMSIAYAVNISGENNKVPESLLEEYFGSNEKRGQLIFLDAYPKDKIELKVDIINPHYPKYYNNDKNRLLPVETEEPVPVTFLVVPKGIRFIFRCVYLPLEKNLNVQPEKIDEINKIFKTAFSEIGFGAKTSLGYGKFREIKNAPGEVKSNGSGTKTIFVNEQTMQAGVYDAIVTDRDTRRNTITLQFNKKYTAIKKNCNGKEISRFQKKQQVKIKISGKIENNAYVVEEIIR